MCKNKNCDYPVTKKKTQLQLAISLNNFQDSIKKENTEDQEWFEMIYKKTIDGKVSEEYCTVCALKKLMITLFLEKREFLQSSSLDFALGIVSTLAISQHSHAVIDDSHKKIKTSRDCGTFLLWFTMRLHRIEYKQTQNVTKEEREIMRGMRRKGESFRDLAYIFERSVSTVHKICQDVEVKETGAYY